MFRNEAAGVRFYASDSAVRAAVEAIEFVGRTLSEISSDAFRRLDNDALDQAADALARGALTDSELLAQLGACTTTRGGFNLFHLFVSPAHATIECRVETRDGQVIRFTAEDKELCLETYLAIGQRDPSTFQKIVAGLTITNIFAKPLGDMAAIMGTGPVALGEENGEALFAMDAAGRFLYRNEITGTYFFANPNDPRDMVVLDTTFELAGIFSGTSVASRVTARVYAGVVDQSRRAPQTTENAPTGFSGRRGSELTTAPFQPNRNQPTTIAGREYTGHALDRMQDRGIPPSVVENTIRVGERVAGRDGRNIFIDSINGVRVITSREGRVISVIPVERLR